MEDKKLEVVEPDAKISKPKPLEIGEKILLNGLVYRIRKKTKKDLILRVIVSQSMNWTVSQIDICT